LCPDLTCINRFGPWTPTSDRDTAYKTMPLFRQYELGCVINAFPASMDDVQPVLEMAREFNAVVVNIIAQVIPSGVEEASLMVQDWMEEAEKEEVNIEFETHRNSVTNDLGYTARLLEAVPDMKLGVDLSHYVVDREFELPLRDEEAELIDRTTRIPTAPEMGRAVSRLVGNRLQVLAQTCRCRRHIDFSNRISATGVCDDRS